MLAAIRQFSKSWIAILLFVLLLISLMIWGGMSDMFKNTVSTAVVRAGSHEVSPAVFVERFNRQLEQAGQQRGQPITHEEAVQAGFHRQMLDQMAAQMSVAEAAARMGLRPAPALIAEQIQQIPDFFNQVTGQFDRKQYQSLLQQNGLTVARFERELGDDIAIRHFVRGVDAGFQAPRIYGAIVAINQLENRSWSSFAVDRSKIAPVPKPTDAQLTAFMNENADRLRSPERRELSVVRFSSRAVLDQVTVDPAEVQKLYNFRKDTMSKPELRSVVQIPAKTQAQAQQAAQRLGKGEDPAAIAKSLGVEPVIYTDKPKTAITDRKVADAAFSLPAGQVSAPVQGELGFAVVKVLEVKPGLEVSFENARPQLEQQVRQDAAQRKIYQSVEAFEKATEGGATLAEAAKAVGATIVSTGPVAQDGRLANNEIAPAATPRLIEKAFSMAQGEESEIEDEGGGEYFAVRVERVTPPALPALETLRPQLTEGWMAREQAKALQAKADELGARLRKGETIEQVAASIGAPVNRAANVDKEAAQAQAAVLGPQLLQAVFGGTKGQVVIVPTPNAAMVVARVDNIGSAPVERVAPIAEMTRGRIREQLVEGLFEQVQRGATTAIKPKVDVKRAAQALGVEEPAAAEPQKTSPPAKKSAG